MPSVVRCSENAQPLQLPTRSITAHGFGVLAQKNKKLASQIVALSSQNDFYEELIAELATMVYA